MRTKCPKCGRARLRVNAGGVCDAVQWEGGRGSTLRCTGIVEPAPLNAPRDVQGRARVRRSVNLLPETAEALTATEVAALADAAVKDGGTDG